MYNKSTVGINNNITSTRLYTVKALGLLKMYNFVYNRAHFGYAHLSFCVSFLLLLFIK